MPDVAKARAIKGQVVAVGPGKWIPAEWWFVDGKWQWFDGYREVPPVYPGQVVYFNSRWNDVGHDYQHPGVGWDEGLHVVQEADIFAIAN